MKKTYERPALAKAGELPGLTAVVRGPPNSQISAIPVG
jgi:hypothetical protein